MEITRGDVKILENPNFLYILEARLRVLSLSKRDKSAEETIPRSYQKNAMLLISLFFIKKLISLIKQKSFFIKLYPTHTCTYLSHVYFVILILN